MQHIPKQTKMFSGRSRLFQQDDENSMTVVTQSRWWRGLTAVWLSPNQNLLYLSRRNKFLVPLILCCVCAIFNQILNSIPVTYLLVETTVQSTPADLHQTLGGDQHFIGPLSCTYRTAQVCGNPGDVPDRFSSTATKWFSAWTAESVRIPEPFLDRLKDIKL